jgi:hypothetical protein
VVYSNFTPQAVKDVMYINFVSYWVQFLWIVTNAGEWCMCVSVSLAELKERAGVLASRYTESREGSASMLRTWIHDAFQLEQDIAHSVHIVPEISLSPADVMWWVWLGTSLSVQFKKTHFVRETDILMALEQYNLLQAP